MPDTRLLPRSPLSSAKNLLGRQSPNGDFAKTVLHWQSDIGQCVDIVLPRPQQSEPLESQ